MNSAVLQPSVVCSMRIRNLHAFPPPHYVPTAAHHPAPAVSSQGGSISCIVFTLLNKFMSSSWSCRLVFVLPPPCYFPHPGRCAGHNHLWKEILMRVAIIGAGPSGLAQLRAFQSAQQNGQQIPELVCYEKQSDWGGLWNYSWRTGLDQHGEPVHGSMYRYLWSNGPKEGLEFADYSFDEHFGRTIGSYPPREVLWDYIKGRVEKADVRKYIRFNCPVRQVIWNEQSQTFSVTAHDHNTDLVSTEEFDHVIVA